MHLQNQYCCNSPFMIHRWDERSLLDPATEAKHSQLPTMKTLPPSPTKSSLKSLLVLEDQFAYEEDEHQQHPQNYRFPQCYNYDTCVPGLSFLSDSDETPFSTSCGSEDFFHFDGFSRTFDLLTPLRRSQRRRRSVRFQKATVREYALTVGDHPTCKDGLALSLDWNHSPEKVYDIEDYESRRQRRKRNQPPFRQKRAARLDYWQRREVLQRVGSFSNHELSCIERQRSRQAVSEFLAVCGNNRNEEEDEQYDGDRSEQEEESLLGVELLEIDDPEDDQLLNIYHNDSPLEWNMKVKVIED